MISISNDEAKWIYNVVIQTLEAPMLMGDQKLYELMKKLRDPESHNGPEQHLYVLRLKPNLRHGPSEAWINAIKVTRLITRQGLKEAKDMVEAANFKLTGVVPLKKFTAEEVEGIKRLLGAELWHFESVRA